MNPGLQTSWIKILVSLKGSFQTEVSLGIHRFCDDDGSAVKNPPTMQETQETWVQSLGQEDALEEEMATRSRILT